MPKLSIFVFQGTRHKIAAGDVIARMIAMTSTELPQNDRVAARQFHPAASKGVGRFDGTGIAVTLPPGRKKGGPIS